MPTNDDELRAKAVELLGEWDESWGGVRHPTILAQVLARFVEQEDAGQRIAAELRNVKGAVEILIAERDALQGKLTALQARNYGLVKQVALLNNEPEEDEPFPECTCQAKDNEARYHTDGCPAEQPFDEDLWRDR